MLVWLKAAIVFMALASALVTATFFYVHRSIRRRYVLLWGFAWLASIPSLGFTWRALSSETYIDSVLSQLFVVTNATLMVAGCLEFVGRRLPTRVLYLGSVPMLAWILVAPTLSSNLFYVAAPGAVMLAASYLWAAIRFELLYRRVKLPGARLLACLLLVAGLHELDYPLLIHIESAAIVGYYAAAILALAIAIGMLIMVLENANSDVDRERARLKGILDNLPVAVLLASPDGEVRLANEQARSLLAIDLERRFPTVAALEEAVFLSTENDYRPPISDALETGRATPARQMPIRTDEHGDHSALVNAGPVRDVDGSLLGAVAVFQDIRELQRVQAEVARAERLQGLGTLAAGVAHDFNNALTMILGHAELASAESTDTEVRRLVDIISAVARDSASIARRIQDLARTRTQDDDVTFDLGELVHQVIDMARPRWRDEAQVRGLQYDVRPRIEPDVRVGGDPADLREALLNLLLNGLDAMPTGGALEFSVRSSGDTACLEVRDTGTGMTREVRERIFDPFFSTKGERGTGLGLAMVFGIIQRHGGRISVTSEEGVGTTFRVELPLLSEDISATSGEIAIAPGRSLRILAVDDEPLVRDLTASLLRTAGHEVEIAANGESAIERVRQNEYDVVLTDLGMPNINGWQVAEAVGEHRPGLPVVLVTGWGESVSDDGAREHNVTAVLSKPFTRKQLLNCVEKVMAGATASVA